MQLSVELSGAARGKRIFIIETDEIVRSALKFMLRTAHEILPFTSVEQAYAKGRTWKPDLVLLGIAVAQAHGPQMLSDIAAQFPGVKILLVADSGDDPLAQACCAAGAHGVLGKPISIDSVRRNVEIVLGRQQQPSATSPERTSAEPIPFEKA